MTLALSPSQISIMEAHAERVYPEECCGLLVGQIDSAENRELLKSVVEVVLLDNEWTPEIIESEITESEIAEVDLSKAINKRRRYWIDPKDMLRVQKASRDKGLNIIGIYHSHPDHLAVPSECDRVQAWPQYAYVIMSVCNGKAVDMQNWALDSNRQFQPEAIRVSPSSARDRMPVSA